MMATIVIVLTVILLSMGIIAAIVAKQNKKIKTKYPHGHWMGVGISIGMAIGLIFGTVIQNIPIGIAAGLMLGVFIGILLEIKNKDGARPLTEQEKQIRKKAVIIGTLILIIGIACFLAISFIGK